MWLQENKDTICGISTARGRGGISIIRVSGIHAKDVVTKLCPFLPEVCESHRIYYGFIRRLQEETEIDEVLVSYFARGRSFTGEETLEISSHGGEFISQNIILELQKSGARVAQRGEFTYRSFMNGRIDLAQAEGVLAMIESESHRSSQLALNQLKGQLSQIFKDIEDQMTYILAQLEVNIDFSSEDIQCTPLTELLSRSLKLHSTLEEILSTYKKGRQIKDGVGIAILGEPNVGKSSLFNVVLGENRAIVSRKAGTTRDYVEGRIFIEGVAYHIKDTAGLRETEDEIEWLGMQRSIELAQESDVIFLVLDLRKPFNGKVNEFISKNSLDKLYFIFNKSDLIPQDEKNSFLKRQLENIILAKESASTQPCDVNMNFLKERSFIVSALRSEGIDSLFSSLEGFSLGRFTEDSVVITQARHFELLKVAHERLSQSIVLLKEDASVEFISFELQEGLLAIQQILGKQYDDEVMNRVFKEFCLGK